MPNPIRSFKKKDGQWVQEGYLFEEEDIANQMAYLFAGADGQRRARLIREQAEQINDLEERKKFIEEQVRTTASKTDKTMEDGFSEIFKSLPNSGKDLSGDEAGKAAVVALMQKFGLTVDPDNVQTNFSPGPPRCFQITWVNRPAPELKDKNSEISQLGNCYGNTLNPDEKKDFDQKMDLHADNANKGGPKIPKANFEMEAAKSFGEFKNRVKQEEAASAADNKAVEQNDAEEQEKPGL